MDRYFDQINPPLPYAYLQGLGILPKVGQFDFAEEPESEYRTRPPAGKGEHVLNVLPEILRLGAGFLPGSGHYMDAEETMQYGRQAEQALGEGRYGDFMRSMGGATLASVGLIPGAGEAKRIIRGGRNILAKQGTAIPWFFGRSKTPPIRGTGPKGRPIQTEDVYRDLSAQSRQRWESQGIDMSRMTPENQELLGEQVAQEVEAAYRTGRWGSKPGDKYMQVDDALITTAISRNYQELLTSPKAEQAFKLALAITSNQQRTWPGYNAALKAYEHFRKHGRFPVDRYRAYDQWNTHEVPRLKDSPWTYPMYKEILSENLGAAGTVHMQNSQFAKINRLLDEHGIDTIQKFLNTKFSVRELRYAGIETTGFKVDESVYGSAILGPKIGNEYFANLMGDPNQITMDRWFMYGYGRLSGNYTKGLEAPLNPDHREFLRGMIDQAQTKLRRRGISLDKNMVQAIWWGLERDIAQKLGADVGENMDYAEAAIRKAMEEGGWTYDNIKRAMEYKRRQTGPLAHERLQPVGGTAYEDKKKKRFIAGETVKRIRARTSSPTAGTQAGPYGPTGDRKYRKHTVGRFQNVQTQPLRLDIRSRNALDTAELSSLDLVEITDPRKSKIYHSQISKAKQLNKHGAAVYLYDETDYEGMRLFMTEDGKSGFALKGDDLVSAFGFPKGKNSKRKPAVVGMLLHGIAQGGRRADSFDTILPDVYADAGLRVVARTRWNDDWAPTDWDVSRFYGYNFGKPDVVYYAYDPNYHGPYRGDEGKLVDTMEEAIAIQDEAIRKFNPEPLPDPLDVMQEAQVTGKAPQAGVVAEGPGPGGNIGYGTGQVTAAGVPGKYVDEHLHSVGSTEVVDPDLPFGMGAVKTTEVPDHRTPHTSYFKTRKEAEEYKRRLGDKADYISGETRSIIRY